MVVVQPTFVSIAQDLGPTVLPNATTLPVAMPSGLLAGHVVLVEIEMFDYATWGLPTAPAGWAMLADVTPYQTTGSLRAFYRYATGSEGSSVNFIIPTHASDRTFQYSVSAVAYRDAADWSSDVIGAAYNTAAASQTSPTYNAVVPSLVVSLWAPGSAGGGDGLSKDAGSTSRSGNPLLSANRPYVLDRSGGPGTTTGTTLTTVSGDPGDNFKAAVVTVGLRPVNSAPYAPPLVSPAGGETIPVGSINRFYFGFSDPDSVLPRPEGQSKYEIRYQNVAAPGWTTLTPAPTTNLFHDFAAATFTTGINYEWQVRSYDLAVEVGPWSTSGFFTGGTAPPAPAITAPTLDEDLDAFENVNWTVTTQTAYQIRRVADSNGSPDTTTIYYDSGTVANGATRSVNLNFPVNYRTEHIQVRVWDGVLWSNWSSVRVEVAYTPPPAPVVNLAVDVLHGSLPITYDTPTPIGDQPTPTHVDIWIDDGGDFVNERKATGLPIDGTWTYLDPRGDRDYELHVHVIAYTVDGIPSAAATALSFFLDSATRGVLDQNVLA